ncbi:hypothetical protein CB1_000265007 [Camelus ferus]|nr:hypothetical protein CB1_000265007 [Camelus ferus]
MTKTRGQTFLESYVLNEGVQVGLEFGPVFVSICCASYFVCCPFDALKQALCSQRNLVLRLFSDFSQGHRCSTSVERRHYSLTKDVHHRGTRLSLITLANRPPLGLTNTVAERMRSEENIYVIEENVYEMEDPYEYCCDASSGQQP